MPTATNPNVKQSPLVSAITIFLNAEPYIEEAITSILAQRYQNWELLLVDDGSTDGGSKIAKQYAQRHPDKIRYLEHSGHQNRGMSASRNLGIQHARGKYIGFLDADDVWLPDKIDHQLALLAAQPEASMVCGNTLYWHSWIDSPGDQSDDYTPEFSVLSNQKFPPQSLLKLLFRGGGTVPCICSFLVERKAVEAVGGFEESFPTLYEDQVFFAKMFLNIHIYIDAEYKEKYRQHSDSACYAAPKVEEYRARQTFLSWLETYLTEKELRDTQCWRQLQNELWAYRHPALHYVSNRTRYFGDRMNKSLNSLKEVLDPTLRAALPKSVYEGLRHRWYGRPPVGKVNFGSLRRTTPISREFGYDRGLPIDRYYIEGFLERQQQDIQGRVLEVGESTYTRRFGRNRVSKSDVLYVIEGNPEATFVGDLTQADHIPSNLFDCIVLTQTLHLIYDMKAAVATLHRILKPGGILLLTVPGISQIAKCDWGDSWCWALTAQSCQKLLEESFPAEQIEVEAHGNVLAAISFLQGLATEELRPAELEYRDREYEVIIAARVIKPRLNS